MSKLMEWIWPTPPTVGSIWQRKGAGIDPALYVVMQVEEMSVLYRMVARPALPGGTVIPMLPADCTVREFRKLFVPAIVDD